MLVYDTDLFRFLLNFPVQFRAHDIALMVFMLNRIICRNTLNSLIWIGSYF